MAGNTRVLIMHCLGWLIFLCLPLLFIAGQSSAATILNIILSPYYWMFLFCYAFLFYTHTFYVFPRWYLEKKYLLYAFYILVILSLILLLKPFDQLLGLIGHHRPPPEMDRFHPGPGFRPGPPGAEPHEHGRLRFDIISISLFFLTLALSIAVIMSNQFRKSQERALLAETEKTRAELSYLKTQIHPHFLFNTLNNIYSLAVGKHENTPAAILKLSNILRYVTEEVSEHYVPLEKEISCIADYIDLQKLRLSSKTTVDFESTGDFANSFIPPMILMTFIENAFKFGVSNHEPSIILIRISVIEGRIGFICQNKLFNGEKISDSTGIGLSNSVQRLDYLYKDKYNLQTGIIDGIYTVTLNIFKTNRDIPISNADKMYSNRR